MRRTQWILALGLALLCSARALPAADPFYVNLLRDGGHAYDRKDYPAAVRDLRLACFGMLDEPKPLADCLARLALAQDRAGDIEGFRETFRRIAEVEERFGAYSQAGLPADLRTSLEQRLTALIPAATLDSVPVFRGLTARKAATTPPGQTGKKPQSETPAEAVASLQPAQPVSALSEADHQKIAEVRRLLAGDGKSRDLKRAFELAREIADAHAGLQEVQHLAAEAAYRLSRWRDAAAYFRRGGEPGADQPELLFYMAVALYESGDKAAAAAALQRSLPNLQRTPYVDAYAKKILGTQQPG
ncbi:MAG TPA: hypothetical protein VMW27_09985 [Thermoanaerobaculia bacterium]|nr:hypothetical protein [Thermoanaerobaculia bacterium]